MHGLWLSRDDIVYVADRINNRVQAFTADGKFLREGFIARASLGNGVAYDVALSADPQQRFVYVPDGTNNHIWILDRATLRVIGNFGRQGRYAGQFHHFTQHRGRFQGEHLRERKCKANGSSGSCLRD